MVGACKNCGGVVPVEPVFFDGRAKTPTGGRLGVGVRWRVAQIPADLCPGCKAARVPPEKALWRAASEAWADASPEVRALAPRWARARV